MWKVCLGCNTTAFVDVSCGEGKPNEMKSEKGCSYGSTFYSVKRFAFMMSVRVRMCLKNVYEFDRLRGTILTHVCIVVNKWLKRKETKYTFKFQ